MSSGDFRIRARACMRSAVAAIALFSAPAPSTLPLGAQTPLEVVDVYDAEGAQLSVVEDLAFSPPDEILIVDRDHPGIVVFGDDGRFRRELGRSGEGPGEFSGLWKAGGDGSVSWGADHDLSRFVVFDSAGRHAETVTLSPLQSSLPADVMPLARLAEDSYLVAAETAHRSDDVDLVFVRSTDGGLSIRDTLGRVLFTDRTLVVPLPDGEAFVPNPFARSSYFSVSSSGDHIALLEQPAPADGEGRLSIRVFGPEGEERWSSVQRYEPRAVTDEDVNRWLDSLDQLIPFLVERDHFPSPGAARNEIREALGPVRWLAGVPVTEGGLLSRSLFVGADGAVWLLRSPTWSESETWLVVQATDGGEEVRTRTVTVPPGIDLYEARGNRAWGVRTGDYGVPTIVELRMGASDDAEAG